MKLKRKHILLLILIPLLLLSIIFLIKKIYKPNDVKPVNRKPSAKPYVDLEENFKWQQKKERELRELGPLPKLPKNATNDDLNRYMSTLCVGDDCVLMH